MFYVAFPLLDFLVLSTLLSFDQIFAELLIFACNI